MTSRATAFDVPTILAVGMVVYAVKNVLHEGVGHGGACVLVGCEPQGLSSAWFLGSHELVSAWGVRAIKAGGTLANLGFAVALLPVWRSISRSRRTGGTLAYFVWLSIVTNLFVGGGYMMVDPIGGFGDWSAFLAGLSPDLPIRIGIVAIGLAVSIAGLRFGARTIDAFLGSEDRRRSARWLCLGPYAVGGLVYPLAAAWNPGGPIFVLTSALATLGGTAWLVWLAFLAKPHARQGAMPTIPLPRSPGWIVAGLVAAVVTIAVLGPGITL